MMQVLLIEDDLAAGDLLTDALTAHHWRVERAADGETGLALASVQAYDLILLDIELPQLDGITVCKQLRSQGYQNPILLLTAKDSIEAQVAGLDAGADDYVTKPFNLEVVLARVRAFMRQRKPVTSIVAWENIQLDLTRGEVSCNGNPVHLTAKEYGLLELFLLHPKRIYSRRAILDRLWDFAESPGEETVSTHIKCVRQKLKAAGAADPIETVHGLGYRLRLARLSLQTLPQPATVNPEPKPMPVRPPARLPDSSATQQKAQGVTARIWDRFKTQYLEQMTTLAAQVTLLQSGTATQEPQQAARQIAHKLVGSLGMFGLMEASQQAKQLGRLMQASALEPTQIQAAVRLVDLLQQAIAQAQTVVPPKVKPLSDSPPTTCQILIVDDDLLLADRLRIEAIAWHLQVEIATDLNVARQMIDQKPPSVILLDLSFPGAEDGLTLMRELEHRSPKIPVVILTAKEDLQDRIIAARLGVSAFLHKPLPAYEILKTVTDVLNQKRHGTNSAHILIVDDDPGFLEGLSALLSAQGVQVMTATSPQTFWMALAACNPDVLILDLELPEFDGVELCQVVRTDPQWQHLKVIFLSAHTETKMITRAYAAGADDYISKATPETELVARVLNRIGTVSTSILNLQQ